jgi:hypothetical protein
MKASLSVNGQPVEMNPFVQTFLSNVSHAILVSLKGTEGAQHAVFHIQGKAIDLTVNRHPVDLHMDKGFAGVVARDTLLGALAHFRGLRGWKEIRVELVL